MVSQNGGPVAARGGGRGARGFALGRLAALAPLALMTAPFVYYAGGFGLAGLTRDLSGETRFADEGDPLGAGAIFLHMAAGAGLVLLSLAQPATARRWPRAHRAGGRMAVALALTAAVGGLVFIAVRGTVGGPHMDVAFSVYGLLMGLAAVQTARAAAAGRIAEHRAWALRLFVLALASWLYRVHYGVWELATGGLGREPDFSGLFDQIQLWAFFAPYLIGLEIYLRAAGGPARRGADAGG